MSREARALALGALAAVAIIGALLALRARPGSGSAADRASAPDAVTTDVDEDVDEVAASPIASRRRAGEGDAAHGASLERVRAPALDAPAGVAVVRGSEEPGSRSAERAAPASPPEPARAHVDAGAPTRGRLAASAIRDVVREQLPQLRFCFEWQLARHPELAGRVTMEFRIAADGAVSEATIAEDALGDETVLRCFRGVVSRMQFPAPEGGEVTVRYPFVLSPTEPPASEPAPSEPGASTPGATSAPR